jgi:energy-coupling factor transporter ATP-binding protein EcfA2
MEQYVVLPPRPKKQKVEPEIIKKETQEFIEDPLRDQEFGAAQQWFKSDCLKPLLIIGPTGSGKTALINYYSEFYKKPYELYDDCLESEFLTRGCFGPKIAVFDFIEDLTAKERQLIKDSFSWTLKRRLIFTSLDAFSEPTKTWTKFCNVIKLGMPSKLFISKVLTSRSNLYNEQLIKDLVDTCNQNLSVAIRSLELMQKTSSLKGSSEMYALVPLDVPKATRQILDGKRLMCMGDSSFLLQQLQINTPQIAKNLNQLAKTMDAYSALEIIDSKHIMDSEMLWHSIDQIATCGPKIHGSKFDFTWPKSLKQLEKPTMKYS